MKSDIETIISIWDEIIAEGEKMFRKMGKEVILVKFANKLN